MFGVEKAGGVMGMVTKQDNVELQAAESASTKLSIVVGENLRQLRRKHGLSLEQLATKSGVSRAMLGQIETGKSAPTINLLGRIAEALKVSVPSLIANPGAGGTVIVPRDPQRYLRQAMAASAVAHYSPGAIRTASRYTK